MDTKPRREPIAAASAPPRAKQTNYPPPLAGRVAGRTKRPLGDLFGLTNFGVNHTTLAPGAGSALKHRHTKQDEFVYVLAGTPTLVTDDGEWLLAPGSCVGFKAGGAAHYLVNRGDSEVAILEIGDRSAGDTAEYPEDDVRIASVDGRWVFTHKDGTPY